ncbi:unnamed protein product [Amoebophrya sp. A120]|nr:unnamed protein product [Amoebophrya sp. A120]|eukprot:GSA120T00020898001.1
MVYVEEYILEFGLLGPHVIVYAELLHAGAGGMERNSRDAGKKLKGISEIAAVLQINPARWKPAAEKRVITLGAGRKKNPHNVLTNGDDAAKLREALEKVRTAVPSGGATLAVVDRLKSTAGLALTVADESGDAKSVLERVKEVITGFEFHQEDEQEEEE